MNTQTAQFEHTDTFGGDANYSWVRSDRGLTPLTPLENYMVDISAAIKQAVYDYLTKNPAAINQAVYDYLTKNPAPANPGPLAVEQLGARIDHVLEKLGGTIEALGEKVESTRSRVRELAEQLDQQREISHDAIVDATIKRLHAVVITKIAEEFEEDSFAQRVAHALQSGIDVADYIDWGYVSRNEIDVETLAERMDFAQMMRETVEELEFRVTVR
jgi:hypothetical protein